MLAIIMSFSLAGCGKDDKAKGEEKKETKNEQTAQAKNEQKAQTASREDDTIRMFNHSASLKMEEIITSVQGVSEPRIVVYGKKAAVAYRLSENIDPAAAEKTVRNKIKNEMPNYDVWINSEPDWYARVNSLYEDAIETEGRTVKNLGDVFLSLKKRDRD